MSQPIIEAHSLSKRYALGSIGAQSFREELNILWDQLRGRAPRQRSAPELWALRDVSFEIGAGEVVGILGRNGAGKSTLLKVLSRITEPTSGKAIIRGRVASLLEVGTGFHPELTGRENVYLNGAILGMRKAEIDQKFDEIVEFAEVEKFIDTPVKRYSSGMHVRLAFAVAAHLEPEILLVDEVLAVGDAAFQRKCLGKMEGVSKSGRTVLFVSHNMVAVETLCPRSIYIKEGRCAGIGPSPELIARYLQDSSARREEDLAPDRVQSDGTARLLGYRILNQDGEENQDPKTNQSFEVRIRVNVFQEIRQPCYSIVIRHHLGTLMTCVNTTEQGLEMDPLPPGEHEIAVRLGPVTFLPALYRMTFHLQNPQGHLYTWIEEGINFEIAQSPLYGTRDLDHRWGCVYTPVSYQVRPLAASSEPVKVNP